MRIDDQFFASPDTQGPPLTGRIPSGERHTCSGEKATLHNTVDPAEVLAALGTPPPSGRALRVRGGDWAAVWRVDLREGPAALRLYPDGSDSVCRREVAVMQAACAAGVPVPAVRVVGDYGGQPAVVMDWCEGRTIAAALEADPSRARELGAECGRALAAIHSVPAPDILSGDPRRSWIDAGGSDPTAVRIADHLRGLPLRPDALLHLDFHPLNVLTDGRRITGVIDWTNAHAGDPWADVARAVSILRLDATRPGVLPSAVLEALPAHEDGLMAGYVEATGTGVTTPELAPFHAWAGAAMLRDLAGRRDEAFFARVRDYRDQWARRAGLG